MDAWVAYASALVSVGSAIAAFIQIGKVWQQAKDTAVTAAALVGNVSLIQAALSDHKVEVARHYATNADLERAIDRLERTLRENLNALNQQQRS
jgi:low affinity Fe/Cu permease